jgi:hypothetical protein
VISSRSISLLHPEFFCFAADHAEQFKAAMLVEVQKRDKRD